MKSDAVSLAPLGRLGNFLIRVFSRDFKEDEREGLRLIFSALSRHPRAVLVLIFANLIAAVFEGGTLGILGLAVSSLVGENTLTVPSSFGHTGEVLNSYLDTMSKGALFLALVVTAIVAQIIKATMLYVGEAAQILLSYSMRRDLQSALTHKVVSMSFAAVTRYSTGKLTNIIDQSFLATDVSIQLSNVLRATLMGLAYFVMMIVISWKMAFFTILIVLVLWLLLSQVSKKLRQIASRVTTGQIDLWRWTVEYLNAPRLIRTFNAANQVESAISKARDLYLFSDRKADLIVAAIPKLLEIITVASAGGFLVGGYLIYSENAYEAVPALFVYVLILFRLRPVIKAFNDYRLKVARVRPRLALVAGIFSEPNEPNRDIAGNKVNEVVFNNEICFRNVSFQFPGESRLVLDQISFQIPKGSTVALVGPSGAGKSTIMDLLIGLHRPSSGEILIDGVSLQTIDLARWREHVGVVDQEIVLLNMSVAENIRFGRLSPKADAVKFAAQIAHADSFIQEMPEKYDTIIGERGLKLSGGQRQRLSLARALFNDPPLLILDEATSALDAESETAVQDALDQLAGKRTMLVIAHRFSTIRKADFVIVLRDGKVIEFGKQEDLLSIDGEFSRLHKLHFLET